MPVRTSAVVAIGLGLLTVIGVGTIFGDSLVAMVAPPPIEAAATKAAPREAIPTPPHPAAGDAGNLSSPDGSS